MRFYACLPSGLDYSGKSGQYSAAEVHFADASRVGYRPFMFSRRGGSSFKNNTIMTGNSVDDRGNMLNSITLMTVGRSLKPLQAFTQLCHDFRKSNQTGITNVFFAGGGPRDHYGDQWYEIDLPQRVLYFLLTHHRQSVSKAIRKLDTVDMDENVKSDIVRDAEYYYSEPSYVFFLSIRILACSQS